jgi:hypothetical protein
MTMPEERTRAMLLAGGFLVELARDDDLPLDLRRRAVMIARHFPTVEDISSMASIQDSSGLRPGLVLPREVKDWDKTFRHGPLRYSTRLAWPESD